MEVISYGNTMVKSHALIQIGSVEHSKAADDYVTDLINIFIPYAQVGKLMKVKSWQMSNVNLKTTTGEVFSSITNSSLVIIKYFDSRNQAEKGLITYLANFTSKCNYGSYCPAGNSSLNFLTAELLDLNGHPIYSEQLNPDYVISCADYNSRRVFSADYPPNLFENVNQLLVNYSEIALQKC
jgi:hypothetical protein